MTGRTRAVSVQAVPPPIERSGWALWDGCCGKPLNLNGSVELRVLLMTVVCHQAHSLVEAKAELLNLGPCHGLTIPGDHLSKVLWKRIKLLLEEQKGCTDGPQLPFVHDKGELFHWVGSASKLIFSGYPWMRQKQGNYGRRKSSCGSGKPAQTPEQEDCLNLGFSAQAGHLPHPAAQSDLEWHRGSDGSTRAQSRAATGSHLRG